MQPGNLSPLYRGEVLVHGLGFSPDHKTPAVVSIGTNSVSFIDTRTNTVKHKIYLGRAPHEAFFTPDGKEVWVTVRGEDYVAVLDAHTYKVKLRIQTPAGPGMHIFRPMVSRAMFARLAEKPDGGGRLQPLAMFMTNPSGSAIVNTTGSIRQIVQDDAQEQRRILVILAGKPDQPGPLAQVQTSVTQ